MKQISNTEGAIDAITLHKNTDEGLPRAIYWAPGDMTRYTVALLAMQPFENTAVVSPTEMLFVNCGGLSIVIPRPLNEFNEYSAELFLAKFGERYAGWWGGVRPLLAGLGWTPPGNRDTKFSHGDAAYMGTLLSRR